MTEPEWYEPDDPTPREQCPCCDFISLAERGNYLICKICYWEDDGQDLSEIDAPSGPNHGLTLRQARTNFRKIGACESEMLAYVLAPELQHGFEHRPRKDPK